MSVAAIAFLIECNPKNLSDWGHNFTITNNLSYAIDSLYIEVGDKNTRLIKDELYGFNRNIDVPKSGYPHHVSITIFNANETVRLICDSYNCDGSHEYILKGDSAIYRFHN